MDVICRIELKDDYEGGGSASSAMVLMKIVSDSDLTDGKHSGIKIISCYL